MQHKGNSSDLGFGHFGNGITVWDRTRSFNNDYLRVAHIDRYRKVTYYDNAPLSQSQREAIDSFATTEHPSASASQEYLKVFATPPQSP